MWRGWGYQNMDHNISRLNIQLAPRLHPDLETFLSRASPCYAAPQGHDSTQKISSDDMRLLCRGGWSAHGIPHQTLSSSQIQVTESEFYRKEVKVALSMSAGSIEITDWRSELLLRVKMLLFGANHRHLLWLVTNENLVGSGWNFIKGYTSSYYKSDYKVRK